MGAVWHGRRGGFGQIIRHFRPFGIHVHAVGTGSMHFDERYDPGLCIIKVPLSRQEQAVELWRLHRLLHGMHQAEGPPGTEHPVASAFRRLQNFIRFTSFGNGGQQSGDLVNVRGSPVAGKLHLHHRGLGERDDEHPSLPAGCAGTFHQSDLQAAGRSPLVNREGAVDIAIRDGLVEMKAESSGFIFFPGCFVAGICLHREDDPGRHGIGQVIDIELSVIRRDEPGLRLSIVDIFLVPRVDERIDLFRLCGIPHRLVEHAVGLRHLLRSAGCCHEAHGLMQILERAEATAIFRN